MFLLVIVFSLTADIAASQDAAMVARGQKAFTEQKCIICHAVADVGNKRGPLDGVGARLTADEIRQWITNAPDMAAKVNAQRKPPMKAFTNIPKEELDALVAYLETLKKK